MNKINKVFAYKHDGSFHRLSENVELLKETKDYYIVLNNKGNLVLEPNKYRWKTKEKAIMYFSKNHWFNVIVMYKKDRIVYYCNLATPIQREQDSLKYIDYELDVKYFVDTKDKILLDQNEYKYHQKKFNYSKKLLDKIQEELDVLNQWIDYEIGPFSEEFRKKYESVGE